MNKRGVGVWGCLSVVFASLGIFSLTSFNSAHAETTLSVSTPSDPILEVSLSSNLVSLDLMPKLNSADLKSGSITVSVGTNNIYGYSLFMDVDNTSLTRTQAINNTTPVIASLADNAEGYTDSTFTANRWGYRTDNGNYFAIPSGETLINSNETQTNQDTTTITFASKVDINQQAGTYNTNINFVVITDSIPLTMQDIETWRGSLVVNQPVKARDARDNKNYYVTKLQTADSNPRVATSSDGKKYQIWMTQNLDLDLSTSKPLTSESTDLNSAGSGIYTNGYVNNNGVISWTPMRATTNNIVNTQNDDYEPYSYDPGNIYYYQGQSAASTTCNGDDCAHWYMGNYYNWNAAVASNDTSSQATQYAQAESSICPKGWKLPAGMTAADKYSDANYLLIQNNIATNYVGRNTDATWASSGYSNIQVAPIYILRSGYFDGGGIEYSGNSGGLWTNSIENSLDTYRLSFNDYSVSVARANKRYYGFPVRCVARNDIKITFNANGGTGTMPTQALDETGGSLTLNAFTLSGYAFAGWNTEPDGSGTSYGDGVGYSGPSTTLYAQWREKIDSISRIVYMQDFASLSSEDLTKVKDSMTVDAQYQIIDNRDNKTYYISKLRTADSNPRVATSSDGKKYQIWMTQNLDLDLSTSKPLTSESTDLNSTSSGIYANGYTTNNGVISWTPARSTTNDPANTDDSNNVMYSLDQGNVYYYKDSAVVSSTCNGDECNHWHAGNYYNWNAAVASNDTSSFRANDVNAPNSICPKGWKLPDGFVGGGYSDFNYLLYQYGVINSYDTSNPWTTTPWATNGYSKIQSAPLYITASGRFAHGAFSYVYPDTDNKYGRLWTGTSSLYSGETGAYYLNFEKNTLYTVHLYYPHIGIPIRCIVK